MIDNKYGYKTGSIVAVAITTLLGIHSQSLAEPIPDGTLLTIDPGVWTTASGNYQCTSGSCFFLDLGSFWIWTGMAGGTDNGIVVGKNQAPGGQEGLGGGAVSTPGELTEAWYFFGNYGTFATLPFNSASGISVTGDASANRFDSASCSGAACIGITELGTLHMAWNETAIPVGSANGCNSAFCTPDQLAGIFVSNWSITPAGDAGLNGDRYVLEYSNTLPDGHPSGFGGIPFRAYITGNILTAPWTPTERPTADSIDLIIVDGDTRTDWTPLVSDPDNGPSPLSCRFETTPSNGTATIANDCSTATYTPNPGFDGNDSLSYRASDGQLESEPASVQFYVRTPRPKSEHVLLNIEPDTAVFWTPVVSDPTNDPLTCRITVAPTNGSAAITPDCSVGYYRPNTGYVGPDWFAYVASDGIADSIPGYVNIDVGDPPPSLPDGTILTVNTGSVPACTNPGQTGSCFGYEAPLGFRWEWIFPGTDSGFILGQDQAPNTIMWSTGSFGAGFVQTLRFGTEPPGGSIFTDATANRFSSVSCQGPQCLGKTVLGTLHAQVVSGNVPPYPVELGSANGCNGIRCTDEMLTGLAVTNWQVHPDNTYTLDYQWAIPREPSWDGSDTQMAIHLQGDIILPPNGVPTASSVEATTVQDTAVEWTPIVSDPENDPLTCRITEQSANGITAVASNCSWGTYTPNPGFTGLDCSTYVVNDGRSDSNVASLCVTVNPFTDCTGPYPIVMVTNDGGGQSAAVNATLSVTFTGHVVSQKNNSIKICPGTQLKYDANSTQGQATCIQNGATQGPSGNINVGDKLICTNKPDGGDTDRFRIID